jgi:DNA ligase
VTLSETTIELLDFIKQNPNPTLLDSDLLAHTYQNLIDTLIEHNHLYYIESSPIISDYEYDQLFSYLKNIEEIAPHLITSNSPTQSLIGQISEGFAKADHRTPLLSLENSYNAQDLTNRDTRIKKILEKSDQNCSFFYRLEPKFDGISCEIIYQN